MPDLTEPLHDAVLLEIHDHLSNDRFGDRERITDIATRHRLDYGIDTDQFAARIDQRTARITGIDGRIRLDKRLDAEFARNDIN